MIVYPDDDKQLDDPAFNRPGFVQVRRPRDKPVPPAVLVDGVAEYHDLSKEHVVAVALKNAAAGQKVQARIDAVAERLKADAEAQAAAAAAQTDPPA